MGKKKQIYFSCLKGIISMLLGIIILAGPLSSFLSRRNKGRPMTTAISQSLKSVRLGQDWRLYAKLPNSSKLKYLSTDTKPNYIQRRKRLRLLYIDSVSNK